MVASVRDALGDEQYEQAHRRGAAMTLDQAIEYAMGEGEQSPAALPE